MQRELFQSASSWRRIHVIFSKLRAIGMPPRRARKNEKRFLGSRRVFCMLMQNRARCPDSAILTAIASCRGREAAEIFSAPGITNMPATRPVHSFSMSRNGNGVAVQIFSRSRKRYFVFQLYKLISCIDDIIDRKPPNFRRSPINGSSSPKMIVDETRSRTFENKLESLRESRKFTCT